MIPTPPPIPFPFPSVQFRLITKRRHSYFRHIAANTISRTTITTASSSTTATTTTTTTTLATTPNAATTVDALETPHHYSVSHQPSHSPLIWPSFALTHPNDPNPQATTHSSNSTFLHFAFDYLLASPRFPIPQLAYIPRTPPRPVRHARRSRCHITRSCFVPPNKNDPIPAREDGLPNLSRDDFEKKCTVFVIHSSRANARPIIHESDDPVSAFFGVSRPPISPHDYIRRLVLYSHSSRATLIIMLVYVQRIAKSEPRLRLCDLNMHRLLITALTLACKLMDDRCFSNAHYARVGGVPSSEEMTTLEILMMRFMEHKLFVEEKEYEDMFNLLQQLPDKPDDPDDREYLPNMSFITTSESHEVQTNDQASSAHGGEQASS